MHIMSQLNPQHRRKDQGYNLMREAVLNVDSSSSESQENLYEAEFALNLYRPQRSRTRVPAQASPGSPREESGGLQLSSSHYAAVNMQGKPPGAQR